MTLSLADLDAATAVVRRHFPATPQFAWPLLGEEVGATVWVKHENQTPTGAFKVRGGLVYTDRLTRERPDVTGIVSATRGNHGQSLAYAGTAAGLRVVIVVPEGNSPDKNAAMEGFGAELVVHGADFQESREHAARLGEELGLETVPSFHADLVAGVATYAKELFDAAGPLDAVYVPVGMGSGIAGLVGVRDLLGLPTRIVGVVSREAPRDGAVVRRRGGRDHRAGGDVRRRRRVPHPGRRRDRPDRRWRRPHRDGPGGRDRRGDARAPAHDAPAPEPAGAIALAGLLAERGSVTGQRVGVILSGGNCDTPILAEVLAGRTPAA